MKIVQNALIALNVLLVVVAIGSFVGQYLDMVSITRIMAEHPVDRAMSDAITVAYFRFQAPRFFLGCMAFVAGWIGLCVMVRRA